MKEVARERMFVTDINIANGVGRAHAMFMKDINQHYQ